jgi:hypothetical protein
MSRRFALLTLTSLLFVTGCGRKVTRGDCEKFFDRNIEVKMKEDGTTDPAAIKKRQQELREQHKDDIDQCVGRRINDSMLKCVDDAQTATDIDKCLR